MRNTLTSLIESIPSTGEWGPIAIRLLEIKKGHQLASLGMSFSSFITELAHKRGKTESTYWRLAKAGEVYSKIRNALDPKGMELPELTDPAVLATPESLEIVEKIRRAAPEDVADATAYKAMNGQISRGELRDLWETYRPILKGKTARGKQYDIPRFNPNDPEMQLAQKRANKIAPVVLSEPDWLRLGQPPYSYRVVRIPINEKNSSSLSAVAVLAETAEQPVILHGFYVAGSPLPDSLNCDPISQPEMPADFPAFAVDFLWLVCSSGTTSTESKFIPDGMGILEVIGDKVFMERKAKTLKPLTSARAYLLSELLRESLRIKLPNATKPD